MEGFIAGSFDAVYVVYAKFNSALSTPPTTLQLLPVQPPEDTGRGGEVDYVLEPSADEILGRILPLYVRNGVYRALVETTAGFYGAQRTAMKNATDNAGDMLNALTRTYNRVRQAAITQEIAEIVGGAAALE
jgi:F-type H+-transporting ATPase subunit gamma